MKTINDYTIYCTPEHTKKALALGAPIEFINHIPPVPLPFDWFACETTNKSYQRPTAEQMIGWLEGLEEIDEIAPMKQMENWIYVVYMRGARSDIESNTLYSSRPEATLAAIDAALDYLSHK